MEHLNTSWKSGSGSDGDLYVGVCQYTVTSLLGVATGSTQQQDTASEPGVKLRFKTLNK